MFEACQCLSWKLDDKLTETSCRTWEQLANDEVRSEGSADWQDELRPASAEVSMLMLSGWLDLELGRVQGGLMGVEDSKLRLSCSTALLCQTVKSLLVQNLPQCSTLSGWSGAERQSRESRSKSGQITVKVTS